jgi:uncharacterized protein with PIN domain
MKPGFVADVHLGKLAKWLRMLGFDTVYSNAFTSSELVEIAHKENLILLSRNPAFEKNKSITTCLITDEEPERQLQQVINNFHLQDEIRPFTRCLVCNGILEEVTKEMVQPFLQANTIKYYNEFWQCTHCQRVYWKGSHYQRMLNTIERIKR